MVLKIDARIFKIDARIFDIDARIFKIDARIRNRFWRLVHLAAELRTSRQKVDQMTHLYFKLKKIILTPHFGIAISTMEELVVLKIHPNART